MPMNYVKTAMLLAAADGASSWRVGALIGGQTGMVIAFVIALGMNVVQLWKSDKMVLRMYGAHEVDERSCAGVLRPRARAGAARRTADAARLRHGQPAAQRIRHRSQSVARGGVRFDRAARRR